MRKSLLLVLATLAPPLFAGCLPNATWLPDSSGFVYTGGKNKDALYLYDLEKKEPRVLVEKGAGPAWPAVSPDGKRIAVVLRHVTITWFFSDFWNVDLEVVVFDRDGKELERSPKLRWIDQLIAAPQEAAAQAFWVPGQERLLIYTGGVTGIYDLKAKTFEKKNQVLSVFGGSPILPDGTGYLVANGGPKGGPAVVGWDGKERKLDIKRPEDLNGHDMDYTLTAMLYCPFLSESRWQGSRAVVRWSDLRVQVDAEKGVATVERIKPAFTGDKKPIVAEFRLTAGGVVRAVSVAKRDTKAGDPDDSPNVVFRVEALKTGSEAPKTLMDGAFLFTVLPSPDGKTAVVHCAASLDAIFKESIPEQDMLFVIDGAGGVADKIDLAK